MVVISDQSFKSQCAAARKETTFRGQSLYKPSVVVLCPLEQPSLVRRNDKFLYIPLTGVYKSHIIFSPHRSKPYYVIGCVKSSMRLSHI